MTQTAAGALLDARQTGTLVARDALEGVSDLATAYEVQKAQLALSGEEIAGWKIGATSQGAQDILGLQEPVFGPVSAKTVHGNGSEVRSLPEENLFIETEFAVTLSSDLPVRSTSYSHDEIAASVAAVHASFEIVGCRLKDGLKGAGHLIVADHGVNAGIVLGGEIPRVDWGRMGEITVELSKFGAPLANGSITGTIWPHIFDAVIWMADQQSRAARGLQAGDRIMTGSCTGLLPILPGESYHAAFSDIASVEFSLVAG